jgi:diketogulonate reductase-like aldo/keto reductase
MPGPVWRRSKIKFHVITKQLGSTNVCIPEIGLGTFRYQAGPELLRQGFAAGALFVDTAESYGTEDAVGEALKGSRDKVFLATKVSPIHFRRADLLQSADASLRRLKTDCIDLYQLHEPSLKFPIAETMSAMEELVDAGKVRFIGVSNFSVAQTAQAQAALKKYRIVANQVRYNLADRTIEGALLDFCQKNRILVIAHTPLARGMSHLLDGDPGGVLNQVAAQVGKTPAQVALNWCLRHDDVVVIPRSNSPVRLLENCAASDWRLNAEQINLLSQRIAWRRRSRLEVFARRILPPGIKHQLMLLSQKMPNSLRRRVH